VVHLVVSQFFGFASTICNLDFNWEHERDCLFSTAGTLAFGSQNISLKSNSRFNSSVALPAVHFSVYFILN